MNAKEQKEHDAKIAASYEKYPSDSESGFQQGYNMAARHIADAIRFQTETAYDVLNRVPEGCKPGQLIDLNATMERLRTEVGTEELQTVFHVQGDTYLTRDMTVGELDFEEGSKLHLNGYRLTVQRIKPSDFPRITGHSTAETSSPKLPADQKP